MIKSSQIPGINVTYSILITISSSTPKIINNIEIKTIWYRLRLISSSCIIIRRIIRRGLTRRIAVETILVVIKRPYNNYDKRS